MHPAYCTPYLGTFSLRVGHHLSWVLNSLVGPCNASEGLFLTIMRRIVMNWAMLYVMISECYLIDDGCRET